MDLLGHLALVVKQVLTDVQDRVENQDSEVRQDHLVLLVALVNADKQDRLDLRDKEGKVDHKEAAEKLEPKEPKENVVNLEQMVAQVTIP